MLQNNFIFKHFSNNNYVVHESYLHANYSHLNIDYTNIQYTCNPLILHPDTIISFVYQFFYFPRNIKNNWQIIIYSIQFGALNVPNNFRTFNMRPFDLLSLSYFAVTFVIHMAIEINLLDQIYAIM